MKTNIYLSFLTLFAITMMIAITGCEMTTMDSGTADGICVKDMDCTVMQTCMFSVSSSMGGSNMDPNTHPNTNIVKGACTLAASSDERQFGNVSFTSGSLDDVFLLAVYSQPTDDSASSEFVSFELRTAVGSSVSAAAPAMLRRLSGTRSVRSSSLSGRWQARINFEKSRRLALDELIVGLHRGSLSLDSVALKQVSAGCVCDNTEMCWKGSCEKTGIAVAFADGTDISCDLAGVLDSHGDTVVNVLVDSSATSEARARALEAAQKFAQTLDREQKLLGLSATEVGNSSPHAANRDIDRDGDGRMTVVFTDHSGGAITSDIVGFFSFPDFLPGSATAASGNESDLLWSRFPAIGAVDLAVGTLVHEYTHLISYALRVQARGSAALGEVAWLDEGIAHLMEDLTGWGGSNIEVVAEALVSWSDAGFADQTDSVAMRGQAFLLLRHLIDSAAGANAQTAIAPATQTAAAALLKRLLTEEELGFLHSDFLGVSGTPDTDSASKIWQMIQGVYATGRDDLLTSAHQYDFLTPEDSSHTGYLMGINTHGDYLDSSGADVFLEGPTLFDEMIGSPVEVASEDIVLSGSALFEVSGLEPGTVISLDGFSLPGVDLRLAVVQVK